MPGYRLDYHGREEDGDTNDRQIVGGLTPQVVNKELDNKKGGEANYTLPEDRRRRPQGQSI